MARRLWKLSLLGLLATSWFAAPVMVGAGPPSSPVVVAKSVEALAVEKIISETNAIRGRLGIPLVRQLSYLDAAALGHSREMLELDYFSHTSPTPGREKTKTRVQSAKGWDTKVGENIYRSSGITIHELAGRVMSAWQKSPSHYQILTNSEFNGVGVGIAPKGESFAITQVFSYQAIAVKEMVAIPAAGGYSLTFEGLVRDGSIEGGVFVNNTFQEPFQADGNGRFTVKVRVPSGSAVSVSQKKGANKYSQSLAFPIEAVAR